MIHKYYYWKNLNYFLKTPNELYIFKFYYFVKNKINSLKDIEIKALCDDTEVIYIDRGLYN